MNLRECLVTAEERGDRPFLHVGDRSWSHAEYAALCERTGAAWVATGLAPGERGAVLLDNRAELLASFHGLASTGRVLVPMNTKYVPDEAAYVLAHSGARTLVTDREHYERVVAPVRDRLPDLREVLLVDGDGDQDFRAAMEAAPRVESDAPDDADVAVVLYTSGTTGRPKGSLTPHAHFTFNGRALNDAIGLGADDVHMTVLPLFHQNAETTSTGTLLAGAQLVVAPRFSRAGFWDEVVRHRVTHAGYLGSIIPLLDAFHDPREGDTDLRVMWGAGLSQEALERLEPRWGVRFLEVFGMTETGLDISNRIDHDRRPGSCGVVVPGKDVRIVDDQDREVPRGTPGQIVVKVMEAVTKGYLNDPGNTEAALRGGWMHTGDMAKQDEDGYFYFLDRYKDIIRRSGENIASADVEAAIRAHDAVEDAACIPVPDPIRGEEVKAVVVLAADAVGTVEPDDLRAWAAERIAPYKVPRYVEFVDDLARTATGKIQKQHLRAAHGARPFHDADAGAWVEGPRATEGSPA